MPSSYFSKFRTGIQRYLGKEGGIQEYVEVLVGPGKLWFGFPRLFQSVNYSCCTYLPVLLRPSTALAASSKLVTQGKTLSVAGTLWRTFSIPSLSGPSFQVCEYHIGCILAQSAQSSISSNFQSKTLAAQLSNVVVGGCQLYNLTSKSSFHLLSTKNSNNICLSKGSKNGEKVIMSLKSQQQPDNRKFYRYFIYNFVKSWHHSCPYIELGLRDFHCLSSCFSAGLALDVSFATVARDEQLKNSVDSS